MYTYKCDSAKSLLSIFSREIKTCLLKTYMEIFVLAIFILPKAGSTGNVFKLVNKLLQYIQSNITQY